MKTNRLPRHLPAIIAGSVLAALLAVILIQNVPYAFKQYQYNTKGVWGGAVCTKSERSLSLDMDLLRGSLTCLGRETWQAGDEITFRVAAQSDAELEIGILPAVKLSESAEYNSYNGFISETVQVRKGDVAEVTVVVPKDGEYGIGIANESTFPRLLLNWLTGRFLSMDVEIDKGFVNPLA